MPGVRLYVRDLTLRSRLEGAARALGCALEDPDPDVAIVDLADPSAVTAFEIDDPRCRRVGFYAHRQTEFLEVADRLGAEPVEKRDLFGHHGLANLLSGS